MAGTLMATIVVLGTPAKELSDESGDPRSVASYQ